MLKSFIFFLGSILISSPICAQEKLIFAVDIVRHGDRTPLITTPDMQKTWPQGAGQLTSKGMHQEYKLGKRFRQRYVQHYHLLPQHYNGHTMNVRSSSMPRTLMSAQSILYGLYPLGTGPGLSAAKKALPEGYQPIPIYTVPLQQDSLLVPNHDKKKWQQLLETHIVNNAAWIQKEQTLQPHYPEWSKVFGSPIHNLFDLITISDQLYIHYLYHLPMPKGLHNQDASTIRSAGKWAWLYMANHANLASSVGNELAQTIKDELKLASQQDRPLKYVLFVAHDTTIVAQLNLLGQTVDDIPPYAANIHYALFDLGSAHYEVRITYNDKPLFIKQCGGERCALEDFLST